jgi:hypothetical protein
LDPEKQTMNDTQPVACTLGAGDLQQRLSTIAQIGADSLTGRTLENGRHVLRFRSDELTRQRLDDIVAAEVECCAFLDLSLADDDRELVLTIAAPADAAPVADDLALAFAGDRA